MCAHYQVSPMHGKRSSVHAARTAQPEATATRSTGHASAPLATQVHGHWAASLIT